MQSQTPLKPESPRSPSSARTKLAPRWPVQLAVLAVAGSVFAVTKLPAASREERATLAERFRFDVKPLVRAPVPAGMTHTVHPYVSHLRGYLYNLLSGSMAMADLDGDGLPNDLCYTDVRAKALMIAPAPGTGDRYAPFAFDFGDSVDLVRSYPIRCAVGDMNEDGLADIFVGFAGRAPLLLLRKNNGADHAEPLSSASFVVRELVPDGRHVIWYSTTSTFVDLDGDGHIDLLVGNYFPDGDELYCADSKKPIDFNDTFSRANNGGGRRVFLWTGAEGGVSPEVRYHEVEMEVPEVSSHSWTFAVAATDIDRDGLSDLYFANDFGPDLFLLNRSTPGKVHMIALHGEPGIAKPRSYVIGNDTFKGMGVDVADINHDGMFDIAVSNISNKYVLAEAHYLWVSNGDKSGLEQGIAHYENRSSQLGTWNTSWGWDIRFDDFDNDGEVEIVQATGLIQSDLSDSSLRRGSWTELQQFAILNDNLVRDARSWPTIDFGSDLDGHHSNPFFVLGEEGRYVDVATEVFPGLTPNTRAIATADVDGDGDLDMAFGNAWDDSQMLVNQVPHPGAFLGLHLLLPIDARDGQIHDGHPAFLEGTPAVGALVEFVHPDGRRMSRQVDGGNGHSGSRSPDLLFGLGKLAKETPLEVHITWRDRSGKVIHTKLEVRPGWHTVTLAANLPRTRVESGTERRDDMNEKMTNGPEANARPAKKARDPRNGLRTSATFATIACVAGHLWFGFEQSWLDMIVALATGYSCSLLFELIDAKAGGRQPGFMGGGIKKLLDFQLSAHMTSITTSFILYSQDHYGAMALAVVLGIGSKYLFRVRIGDRYRHFFNPSNFGLAATLTILPWATGIPWQYTADLPGAGNTVVPLIALVLGVRLNAIYTKRLPIVAAFVVAFVFQAVGRAYLTGVHVNGELVPLSGFAMVLFALFMITDPMTSPSRPRNQIIFGASIALVYGALVMLRVVYVMFYAVTIVAAARGLILYVESLRGVPVLGRETAPTTARVTA